MSDEPTIRVTSWGPVRIFGASVPPCPECGCDEPSKPAHHASGCSRGPTPAERDRIARQALDDFKEDLARQFADGR